MIMSSKTKKRVTNFDEMTLLYRRFLILIGILPFDGRDFSYLASQLLLVYHIVSSVIHGSMFMFYAINEHRQGRIPTIDTICETVVAIGIDIRYYLLLYNRLEFANLLKESRAIWDMCDAEGHRAVRQFEQKLRVLFYMLLGSTVLGNVLYTASAVSLNLNAAHINDTQTRFLPFKWYSENGPDLWPGFKITFAIQVLVIHNACIMITTVDLVGSFLIMIGAGYFRALGQRISQITENEDKPKNADCELIACVRLHQRIFRINIATKNLFFLQILCTGYNISLAGIKLAGTDPDRYKFLPLALLQLAQLLAVQWAPDNLIDESTAISWAVYCVSHIWIRRPMGKLLVIIMTRSQRPIQMTAAGIIHLSLEKFGTMLTSAVSFFTVLRKFDV